MKLFNIIIPAYNSVKTIEKTVNSLQNSGMTDFSIIIVNDGSSDNTESICKRLEYKYNNVKYCSQNNQGVSAARNKGIDLADAEYLIFFDADDCVEAGAYVNAERIIQEIHPDMLIYGMCFDYYHNGKIFRTDKMMYPYRGCYSANEIQAHFKDLYETNSLTSSCNKIIKREILQKYNVRYVSGMFLMEDFLFSLDCLQYCKNVYMLPEAIYRYHQSEDEGNAYRRIRRIESLTDFVKPFEMRLQEHPDIFNSMYFMMLNQKLWFANRKEIKKIAEDHLRGNFVAYRDADRVLDDQLKNGRYLKIRCKNLMLQGRHIIANYVKRTSIYQRMRRGEWNG